MSNNDNMSELPKSWIWTTLGEIVTSIKGKKPARSGVKSNYFTIPYIDIQAFERKVFTQFTDDNGCPTCKQDDVLIVWDGARFGLVGKGVAGVIGSTLAKLTCYELDSGYLFNFIQSQFELINSKPRGVGIPHVEPILFWNIDFPLPPLPEQHRIVAKIEELFACLDAGIEALKKIRVQLKRYRQSVLRDAFVGKLTAEWREVHKGELEPASVLLEKIKQERKRNAKGKYKELPPLDTPELPEGWVWTRLGEIMEPSDEKIDPLKIGKMPYIGLEHIERNTGKLLSFGYSDETVSTKTKFYSGDLLYGKLRPYLNKVYLAGFDGVCSTDILSFPKSLFISNKFLKYRFLFEDFVRYASQNVSGVQHPRVSFNTLAQFMVSLPPLSEQYKTVEEIDCCFSLTDEVEIVVKQSLKQAERLRRSILKRAFEGKLAPQDPNDEPAEKLLERIRAEKAKREAEKKAPKGKKHMDTRQRSLR